MSPFNNFWIHLKVQSFNLRSVFVVYVYLMFIHNVIFSCCWILFFISNSFNPSIEFSLAWKHFIPFPVNNDFLFFHPLTSTIESQYWGPFHSPWLWRQLCFSSFTVPQGLSTCFLSTSGRSFSSEPIILPIFVLWRIGFPLPAIFSL